MREAIRGLLRAHSPSPVESTTLSPASVLIPLYERNERVHLLFTQRTQEVEVHKGQISFPGGMRDETDDGPVATALRETFEEVGIAPDLVDVLGTLDELATPSGFRVTPVAGWIPGDVRLSPHAPEVEEILHVPLRHLLDGSNYRTEVWDTEGGRREVCFFDYGEKTIWGVTGAILRSFLDLIGNAARERGVAG